MTNYLLNAMFDVKNNTWCIFLTINVQLTSVTYPILLTVHALELYICYIFFPYFKSHKNLLIN